MNDSSYVRRSGLPLVSLDELGTVTNAETVEAIHAQRDGR